MRKGFLSPKSLPLNAVSASPQEVGALQDLAGVMLSLGHSDPDIVLSCVNVYQSSFCVDGLDPSGCALRTHAIEGGVLAWIIAAMRVHEREVSLQGASLCAIRNLSLGQTPGDARNRQKIILAGGLEAATRVAQVHPTKDGLLIAATWLLRALLYDERHDDVSRACEAGAPASLVAAFSLPFSANLEGSERISSCLHTHCAWLFAEWTCSPDRSNLAVRQHVCGVALCPVVRWLRDYAAVLDEMVAEECLRFLGNVLQHDLRDANEWRRRAVEDGAVEAVVKLMQAYPSAEFVPHYGCSAITNLCCLENQDGSVGPAADRCARAVAAGAIEAVAAAKRACPAARPSNALRVLCALRWEYCLRAHASGVSSLEFQADTWTELEERTHGCGSPSRGAAGCSWSPPNPGTSPSSVLGSFDTMSLGVPSPSLPPPPPLPPLPPPAETSHLERAAAAVPAQQSAAASEARGCRGCGQVLGRAAFSKAQLKKGAAERRCIDCVGAPQPPNAPTPTAEPEPSSTQPTARSAEAPPTIPITPAATEPLLCVVCLDEERACVMVPCGHRVLCTSCAAGQWDECPVCRAKCDSVMRVYDS